MRVLEFDVINQEIKQSPMSDFSGLMRNSGNLIAKFNLSKEWSGYKVAASFFKLGEEFPEMLKDGKCAIPAKALTWKEFSVQIVGIKDGMIFKTNKLVIKQEG